MGRCSINEDFSEDDCVSLRFNDLVFFEEIRGDIFIYMKASSEEYNKFLSV